MLQALRRDLESARFEATRAQRQFDAADSENRLVTEELERRWDAMLERVAEVEHRISQCQQLQVASEGVNADEFAELASDLDALWDDLIVGIRTKKRIIRTLIEDIIADLDADPGEVVLTIHWVGGVHTELRVPRRQRGKATATSNATIDAIRILSRICSVDMIASWLNRNGLLTGRGNRFTRERITSLRRYHNIACDSEEVQNAEGWLNLTEEAKSSGVSNRTLRLAINRGDVIAEHRLPDGPWIIHRDELITPKAQAVTRRVKQRRSTPAIPHSQQKNLEF